MMCYYLNVQFQGQRVNGIVVLVEIKVISFHLRGGTRRRPGSFWDTQFGSPDLKAELQHTITNLCKVISTQNFQKLGT
jgi:hypothetical protein